MVAVSVELLVLPVQKEVVFVFISFAQELIHRCFGLAGVDHLVPFLGLEAPHDRFDLLLILKILWLILFLILNTFIDQFD